MSEQAKSTIGYLSNSWASRLGSARRSGDVSTMATQTKRNHIAQNERMRM